MKFNPWFNYHTCCFFLLHNIKIFTFTCRVIIMILAIRALLIRWISYGFRSRVEVCIYLVSTSTPNRMLHKFEIFRQSDLVTKNLSSFILFQKAFDSCLYRCDSSSTNCEYLFCVWLLENRIIFCFEAFSD